VFNKAINDVIACFDKISEVIELTRQGNGPTVVEAISYRLSDHTTADDAGRYRSSTELDEHWLLDPISRLKTYLLDNSICVESELNTILDNSEAEVAQQVKIYLDTAAQAPESMFDYLYESLPEALSTQRQEVVLKGRQNDG